MHDGNVNENRITGFAKALKEPPWDIWLYKDTEAHAELLQLNENFQSQVEAIRTKFEIDPAQHKMKQAAANWVKALKQRQQEWDDYVNYIMAEANLMSGWRRAISTYILTNKFFPPPAILIHDTPDRHGQPSMQLTINDEMSQQDLTRLLKHVQSWIKYHGYKRRHKRKPYEYLPFYILMSDLRKAGLDNACIAETFRANFDSLGDEFRLPDFTTTFVRNSLRWLDTQVKAQMS